MKVLMLGWEFPPFISGGLGTACYGLTRGLNDLGIDIVFVLPRASGQEQSSHVQAVAPAPASALAGKALAPRRDAFEHVRFYHAPAALLPYARPAVQGAAAPEVAGPPPPPAPAQPPESPGGHYEGDLFQEVQRYAALAGAVARQEHFDIVHAHDWMTFPAGLAAAALARAPLVVHVHSTEFDRSGQQIDRRIYGIEQSGMRGAAKVIAVSFLTKNMLVRQYQVPPEKIAVVYNALTPPDTQSTFKPAEYGIREDEKVVLFLGRMTAQKGPEYFLAAARKVLEVVGNVKFVMAGSGDMIGKTIALAAEMGLGEKVLFTGFLESADVERVFKMADVYVMPSISEPFGIAPLEALNYDVPTIISRQSGVSEVLRHVLKVDFWDVTDMADKIIAVLRHPPLADALGHHGRLEARQLRWIDSARQIVEIYNSLAGPEASGGSAGRPIE